MEKSYTKMPFTEAVVQICSVKKVFLKISHNSQESTCARVSFLIKLQAFFHGTPPVAVSVNRKSFGHENWPTNRQSHEQKFQTIFCMNWRTRSWIQTPLTHLFRMHPFSTPWKHQKTLRFSDVFRGKRKDALGTSGSTYQPTATNQKRIMMSS